MEPVIEVDGPVIEVDGPVIEVDGPVIEVDGPVIEVDGPVIEVDGPVIEVDGPVIEVDGPVIEVDGPAPTIDGPLSPGLRSRFWAPREPFSRRSDPKIGPASRFFCPAEPFPPSAEPFFFLRDRSSAPRRDTGGMRLTPHQPREPKPRSVSLPLSATANAAALAPIGGFAFGH